MFVLSLSLLYVNINNTLTIIPCWDYNGYAPNTYKHNSTQQELGEMSLTSVKLQSISKGVPVLSAETWKLWKFQLEINTKQCDDRLGRLIFDNPKAQGADDLAPVFQTEEVKSKMKDYKAFKDEFKQSDGYSKLLGHAHAEILKTLDIQDKEAVMQVAYPDPVGVYKFLLGEYRVNTRLTRTAKFKEFINMEMEKEETLSSFVQKIGHSAADLSAMGSLIEIKDELKLVVLLEGVRPSHGDNFNVVLELLDQQDDLTFAKAVAKMRPVARRYELDAAETAKKAAETAKKAAVDGTNNRGAAGTGDCFDYRDYGECKFGSACKWHHGVPGTMRCTYCGGKHRPKICTKKNDNRTEHKAKAATEVKAKAQQSKDIAAEVKAQVEKQMAAAAKAEAKEKSVKAEAEAKAKAKAARAQPQYFDSDSDDDYDSDTLPEVAKVAKEAAPVVQSKHGMLVMFLVLCLSIVFSSAQKLAGTHRHFGSVMNLLLLAIVCSYCLLGGGIRGVSASALHVSPVAVVPNFPPVLSGGCERAGFGAMSTIGEVCMMADSQSRFQHVHRLKQSWSIDSACTTHITMDMGIFTKRTIQHKSTKIETADGSYMHAPLMGDAVVRVKDSRGTINKLRLKDVLYVPTASSNLISVARLLRDHHRIVFDNDICTIFNRSNGQSFVSRMRKHLFDVHQVHDDADSANVADSTEGLTETQLWHNRLCHYSAQYVHKAVPAVKGDADVGWCQACVQGGIQKRPFTKKSKAPGRYVFSKDTAVTPDEEKTQERLDIVKADTCQPFSDCLSTAKNNYFFLFVDVHTRKKWIKFGRRKSDLKREFREWLAEIENQTGRKPIEFSPDGGGEFDNKDLIAYLQEKGILFQISCTDCPNQNAIVERANRTVNTHIHKLLAHSGLPNKYWEDAARFSVAVQNAIPVKTIGWQSPNAAWDPKRKDKTLDRIRTFGCEAWYVVPKAHRRKGDNKARKGVYLGTSIKHKGWRILDLEHRKIVNSRDVYFHENKFPFMASRDSRRPAAVAEENGNYVDIQLGGSNMSDSDFELPEDYQFDSPAADESGADEKHDTDIGPAESPPVAPRRSSRARNVTDYSTGTNLKTKLRNVAGEAANVGYTGDLAIDPPPLPSEPVEEDAVAEVELPSPPSSPAGDPTEIARLAIGLEENFKSMTRRQVMKGPYRDQFLEAEDRELQCLKLHGTYRSTKLPRNRSPISCRWCYDVKRDADNNIILFKARLVARGYEQQEGVDYNETFAATAQMKSFRMVVALSRLLKLHMTQVDVSSAFLHGDLQEEIYMKFPPGYKPVGSDGKCLRLIKGLYGLKQAGRIWNIKFVDTLKEIGFVPLISDTQVLQLRRGKSVFIIGLHVDDAILATNDERLRKEVVSELQQRFLVKDLGPLSHYLGMRVVQGAEETKINQDGYVDKVLARFKMENAKSVDTPGVPGQILTKDDCPAPGSDDEAEMKGKPYRQLVGSLMYTYCGTRPDVGSNLAKVASFSENPGVRHWVSSKRILRYLKGTRDHGICFRGRLSKGEKVKVVAYCDSDWAQCPDDRKSTTGYVVQLAGGPVVWQCRKQATVAVSSTEAEFVALSEATKDILWMTYMLTELGIPYEVPRIYTDSQSSMDWAKNASHHQRNKHVALKYFFVRDVVANNTVQIAYISTKENIADILTKPTTRSIFKRLRPKLMGFVERAMRATARGLTSISERGCAGFLFRDTN